MDATMSEVVQFIQENDVKFIRLAFCDIFGNQKNIAIMPTELTRAFEQGIHFNASALRGFLNVDDSDLLLFPDAATLSVLPWRPAQGRVVRFYCDIRYPDGRPFEGDGRHLLREASRRARRAGYALTMGTASEFYLFELDENGHPTTIPHDHGEYFDVAPLDKAENVRRQICLTLEEMGIQPESSHHEQGPGQNNTRSSVAEALEAADNFVTFKWVVKSMASLERSVCLLPAQAAAGRAGQRAAPVHLHPQGRQKPVPSFLRAGRGGPQLCRGHPAPRSRDDHFRQPADQLVPASGRIRGAQVYHLVAPQPLALPHRPACGRRTGPPHEGARIRRVHQPLYRVRAAHPRGVGRHRAAASAAPGCDENLFTAPDSVRAQYQSLPASLCDAVRCAESSEFVARYLPKKARDAFFAAKQTEHDRIALADDRLAAERALYFERY